MQCTGILLSDWVVSWATTSTSSSICIDSNGNRVCVISFAAFDQKDGHPEGSVDNLRLSQALGWS
jgi:hypothetical protein